MGNNDRDFFDFEDDPFEDDGGEDFGFDSSPTQIEGDTSSFAFPEEPTNFNDFDEFGDFDDIEEDFTVEDETQTNEEGGPSRTFIILALLMVLFFIGGLILVIILATRPRGLTDIQIQSTQIAQENNQTLVAFNATNTAKAIDITQTFEAVGTQAILTATANAQATFDAGTLQAMNAEETALAQTRQAQDAFATQTAEFEQTQQALTPTFDIDAQQVDILNATQTAQASNINATLTAIAEGISQPSTGIGEVALTATAIAQALRTQPTADLSTPVGGGVVVRPTPTTPSMPDSGLFDDLSGGGNMALIALMAFGLIGIIFGARVMRNVNNRKR